MKKLMNHRDTMVADMIGGFLAAYPDTVAGGTHPRLVRRKVAKSAERVRLLRIYDYAERAAGRTRRHFRPSETIVRSVGRHSSGHNDNGSNDGGRGGR